MNYRFPRKPRTLGIWMFAIGILSSSLTFAQCPSEEKVAEGLRKMLGRDVSVLKVQRSAMSGLCEAQMSVGGRKDVFYTDAEGSYLIRGPLYDVEKGTNLTEQVLTQLNRLNAEEMKQLEALVAFTAGTGPKVVYFVTDPQCPYCERGLKILKGLIDQGKLTVKFVLYPLAMHEGADKQCISIICDSKGLEGLESQYKSENQCPEGREKVVNAVSFFKEKGIAGTPAYFFEDGTYQVGVMKEEALLK